jgi:mono/diheme cytochrome c family protein
MRRLALFILFCSAAMVALTAPAGDYYAADAKVTIKEVMNQAHKKPKELLKKAATGRATNAEKAELLELYKALAASKPPKGDAASWKEKTGVLVSAAQAAVEGKPDAGAQLTRAGNCAACHAAHK